MLSHKHSSSFKIENMPFIPAPGMQKEWLSVSLREAWSSCRVSGQLELHSSKALSQKMKGKKKSPPNNYITYVFMDAFSFMNVYTVHACSGHRSQKRVSNLLELECQVVFSCHVSIENQTGVFYEINKCCQLPNCLSSSHSNY